MSSHLIAPHGTASRSDPFPRSAAELKAASRDWPSWDLTPRQLCDLELLLNGGFSPLTRLHGASRLRAVCEKMRLADGTLVADADHARRDRSRSPSRLKHGSTLALRDAEGVMLAVLHVDDVWKPDRDGGSREGVRHGRPEHPGVGYPANRVTRATSVAGSRVCSSRHYDYRNCAPTPRRPNCREHSPARMDARVVAFQTRNPMHRAHHELTLRAAHGRWTPTC